MVLKVVRWVSGLELELERELTRAIRIKAEIALLSGVGFALAFALICASVLMSNMKTIKVAGVVLGIIYLVIMKQ